MQLCYTKQIKKREKSKDAKFMCGPVNLIAPEGGGDGAGLGVTSVAFSFEQVYLHLLGRTTL